jgi:hypothetical protein
MKGGEEGRGLNAAAKPTPETRPEYDPVAQFSLQGSGSV